MRRNSSVRVHCYTCRVARYHVESFGCRASQADGDAIAAALDDLRALPAEGLRQADVIVVNTCSVTAEAERDARAYIRRVRRVNPSARVLVTGCYAQRAPEEVAEQPGVYAVVGNSHKNHVASIALGADRRFDPNFVPLASLATPAAPMRPLLLSGDIFAHSDFQSPFVPAFPGTRLPHGNAAHRTRPSLKIQDGCGNRCTFCIIPSTRGNSRSLPRENVLDAVRAFADGGGKEIAISGINLGRWGRDLAPRMRLEDLLAEIFETTALPRLRISSVEPMDWTDNLIALFARWGTGRHPHSHPRLARHVHMPLQSGSDTVLRRMHRRYRPWHYAERVAAVRAAAPDAAIGADVMVGFPGETDEEFEQSYAFIAAQPFTYLHLFPFSARPGTPGWEMHRQHPVSGVAVRKRMAALRTLIDCKNLTFRSAFVGKDLSAVTLISTPDSFGAQNNSTALTDNFLPVELDGTYAANTLLQVRVTGTAAHDLSGRVLAPSGV